MSGGDCDADSMCSMQVKHLPFFVVRAFICNVYMHSICTCTHTYTHTLRDTQTHKHTLSLSLSLSLCLSLSLSLSLSVCLSLSLSVCLSCWPAYAWDDEGCKRVNLPRLFISHSLSQTQRHDRCKCTTSFTVQR